MGNHSTEIDYLLLPNFADKMGLMGSSTSYMKKSLLYFPIFGQLGFFYRFIFLDRPFQKDEKTIQRKLSEFIRMNKTGTLLMYPEGTRFTLQKYESSKKFAQSNNLPVFNHHLLPRTKGFKTSVELMKKLDEKCCVLNLQSEFKGQKPTFLNLLRGQKMDIHIFIESFPVKNVEKTDEWLYNMYRTKDDLHESFEKFGNFYQGRNDSTIEEIVIELSIKVLINYLFWFAITMISCSWFIRGRFFLHLDSKAVSIFSKFISTRLKSILLRHQTQNLGKFW